MDNNQRARNVVGEGGSARREKKGLTKLADIIFTSDKDAVKDWLLYDQLLPWLKGTAINAISRFTLNGRNGYSGGTTGKSSTISYNTRSQSQPVIPSRTVAITSRSDFGVHETDDLLILPKNGTAAVTVAAQILHELDEIMEKYGMVRVLDYYSAAGATGSPECQNYGWYDITKAAVMPLPDGNAWINFPKPVVLNR